MTLRHFKLLTLLILALTSARPLARAELNSSGASLVLSRSQTQPRLLFALIGSERFSFCVPLSWSVVAASSNSFRAYAPEQRGYIAVEFRGIQPTSPASEDFAEWQNELKRGRPGSHAGETFSYELLSSPARGVDLSWIHGNLLEMEGRFVRVSAPTREIELSLVAFARDFEDLLPVFVQLSASIKASSQQQILTVRPLPIE